MRDSTLRGRHPNLFATLLITGVLGAVVLSAVLLPHEGFVARERFALAFVLVVSIVARVKGVRAGAWVSFAAFAVLLALEVATTSSVIWEDIVDLIVDLAIFLGVALAQGVQTGELREREQAALVQKHETEVLMQLSAQLVPDSPVARVLDGVEADLTDVLGARDFTLFLLEADGELQVARPHMVEVIDGDPEMLSIARWVHAHATAVGAVDPAVTCGNGAEWPEIVGYERLPGVTGRDDLFLPLVSQSAVEGVLRVAPRSKGHVVDCRELASMVFVARLFATFRERQRLQESAGQAEMLRESDLLKTAFVSSVSHELGTPLAAANATVTSLLEAVPGKPALDEETRDDIESVARDLAVLQQHIGQLLEVSRLEASEWRPTIEWNDVADLCATVRGAFPEAERRRIQLQLEPDLPLLQFDFVQLSRALHHIIENALSYSGPGETVHVGAQTAASGVRIWVEDAGPGVPDVEKEAIFQKFFRGEGGAQTPHGTGLGLAIVRDIVAFHGGRVWVEDVSPHGARFVMELPQGAAKGKAGE